MLRLHPGRRDASPASTTNMPPRLCGDRPGIYHAHATELAGLAGRS